MGRKRDGREPDRPSVRIRVVRQGREKPQRRPYKGGSRKDGRCLAEGGNRGPPPPPPATEGGDAEKAWHTSP